MKLMSKHQLYKELLISLGESWDLLESNINLEKFTCSPYDYQSDTINLLRHKLCCSKKGKCDIDKLLPCKSSLVHCSRTNYQCCVWRLSLEACPNIWSPHKNGWTIDDNGISIKWMSCKPAPEEVMFYFAVIFLNIHLLKVITLAKCYLNLKKWFFFTWYFTCLIQQGIYSEDPINREGVA